VRTNDWPESWPAGSIVRVDTDLFAECESPWVCDSHGNPLNHELRSPVDNISVVAMTLTDLRRDFFRVLDSNPSVWFLCETERPEQFHHCLMNRREWDRTPPPTSTEQFIRKFRRPNLAIAISVTNQSDAYRILPELIRCRDLCGKLCVYWGGEGPVDWDLHEEWSEDHGGNVGDFSRTILDLIIIRARPDAPVDLNAVIDTVQQCYEAGVQVWIETSRRVNRVLFGICQKDTRKDSSCM